MVNKIIRNHTYYVEMRYVPAIKEQLLGKIANLAQESLVFTEYTGPEPSRSNKLIVYNNGACLRFTNFFFLILAQWYRTDPLYQDREELPDLLLNFAAELPDFGKIKDESYDDPFPQFLEELKKSITPREDILPIPDHPFWSIAQELMINLCGTEAVQVLCQPEHPKMTITSTALAQFSVIRELFDLMILTLPQIKKRYVEIYPQDFFKGKSPFSRGHLKSHLEGLAQLHRYEKSLLNLHEYFYKDRDEAFYMHQIAKELREILQEITLGNREGRGLFRYYLPDDILVYVRTYEECIAKGGDPSQHLKDLVLCGDAALNPLIEADLTLEDLTILVVYYCEMNRVHNLFYALLYQPTFDLCSGFLAIDKAHLNARALRQLVLSERIPFFRYSAPIEEDLSFLLTEETTPIKVAKKQKKPVTAKPKVEQPEEPQPSLLPLEAEDPISFHSIFEMRDQPISLHHVAIYLQDLNELAQFSSSALACVSIWNASYRALEQTVRYLTTQDSDKHLLQLLPFLSPEDHTSLQPFVKTYSLAHLWTEQTMDSYQIWKSNSPPLLRKIHDLFAQSGPADTESIDEALMAKIGEFLPKEYFPISLESIPLKGIKFEPLFFKVDSLLAKMRLNTSIARRLMEWNKDLRLLNELERLMEKEITSGRLPFFVRLNAKLHHALLQHLLQGIYMAKNPGGIKEHDLIKLIKLITWKRPLPKELLDSMEVTFGDLHRLSNYPFDARIATAWHRAMIEAEVIRADPQLLQGFRYTRELKIGPFEVDTKTVSLERVLDQIKESRKIVVEALPLLIEELKTQIT